MFLFKILFKTNGKSSSKYTKFTLIVYGNILILPEKKLNLLKIKHVEFLKYRHIYIVCVLYKDSLARRETPRMQNVCIFVGISLIVKKTTQWIIQTVISLTQGQQMNE